MYREETDAFARKFGNKKEENENYQKRNKLEKQLLEIAKNNNLSIKEVAKIAGKDKKSEFA